MKNLQKSSLFRLRMLFGMQLSNTHPSYMNTNTAIRKQFDHLRKPPGKGPGWYSRAARDLGYAPSYISRLARGEVKSPAAEAALAEWKLRNNIAG